MKLLRLFFLLTLGLGLLGVTTRALAESTVVSPAIQSTVAPGTIATDIASRLATMRANQKTIRSDHLVGTITAIDSNSMTLTLRNGSSVILLLSPNTRTIAIDQEGNARPGNLNVGRVALVRCVRDQNDLPTALVVLIASAQPIRIHLVGTVTEYTAGASITIQAMDGKSYMFTITERTDILSLKETDLLGVGSRVTIVTLRRASEVQSTALGIVVLPVSP